MRIAPGERPPRLARGLVACAAFLLVIPAAMAAPAARAVHADNVDTVDTAGSKPGAVVPRPLASRAYLPWLHRDSLPAAPYVPDRLVVRYHDDATAVQKRELQLLLGAQVLSEIPQLGLQVLQLTEPERWLPVARSSPLVASAELDFLAGVPEGNWGVPPRRPSPSGPSAAAPVRGDKAGEMGTPGGDARPDDPMLPEQWHHERIGSDGAWSVARATGVVVAVVDTGVDCDHPDLRPICVGGYDFVDDDEDPRDPLGHGTHVAGIAAATVGNGLGGAGVAWGALVMPLRVIDDTAVGSYTDIARAIVWAADHGADVINMSIGGPANTKTLQDAVQYARSHGIVMVAAAGNAGGAAAQYPAAHEGVVAVAATDSTDERAPFSNYGRHIDLSAPGTGILSTSAAGGYARMTGTSMAAPVVAGLAALLSGYDEAILPPELEGLMQETAQDIGEGGWDALTGFGRIDAGAALAMAARPTATPTDQPRPTATPIQVRVGETVRGSVEHATVPPRYCFDGADWVSIRMFGRLGFDPLLKLFAADGREPVAVNDNGEGIGANSFLTSRLVPGRYCVEAAGTGRGEFALRIEGGRAAGVGDVDKSCAVDQEDSRLIEAALGHWLDEDADLDLDGHVTPVDLIIWRGNYARELRCP